MDVVRRDADNEWNSPTQLMRMDTVTDNSNVKKEVEEIDEVYRV